jgi:hypothetical protein
LAGRRELAEPLAGKSTLNRLELGSGTRDRYKKITYWKESVDELLVKLFIESYGEVPEQIMLDVDTTERWQKTGKPARVFSEFEYQTQKRRRAVGIARAA